MKQLILLLACCATFLSVRGAEIKHRFVCVDNAGNKLILVDQLAPEKGWSIAIPAGSRDLQRVGDKVLVSHGNGAAEYDLAKGEKGWSVSTFKSISTAQRLPNGNTLLGTGEPAVTLVEIDKDGKEVKKILSDGVGEFRLARRLADGKTIFTGSKGGFKVYECDPSGAITWSAPLTGKGYLALRQENGNTFATTGETVTVIELDKDGKILSTLGSTKDHANARLLWFSGFHRIANGNFVVANWCGHGKTGQGPHVVEFDAGNKLVWQWEDHVAAKTVTNVLVLE